VQSNSWEVDIKKHQGRQNPWYLWYAAERT